MAYRFEPHQWRVDRPVARLTGRAICVGCGVLRLKNLLTDWIIARGCNYGEHQGYPEALRHLPAAHRLAKGT